MYTDRQTDRHIFSYLHTYIIHTAQKVKRLIECQIYDKEF